MLSVFSESNPKQSKLDFKSLKLVVICLADQGMLEKTL